MAVVSTRLKTSFLVGRVVLNVLKVAMVAFLVSKAFSSSAPVVLFAGVWIAIAAYDTIRTDVMGVRRITLDPEAGIVRFTAWRPRERTIAVADLRVRHARADFSGTYPVWEARTGRCKIVTTNAYTPWVGFLMAVRDAGAELDV